MTTLSERLQAHGREFRKGVIATPAVVGMLRDLTELHLHKWGLSAQVETATLVVSELVTNAVNVSRGRLIGFQVVCLPAVLVIEVWDPAEAKPAMKKVGPVETTGRGLLIVETVTQAWGIRDHPPETGGKTVWACLALESLNPLLDGRGFEAGHGNPQDFPISSGRSQVAEPAPDGSAPRSPGGFKQRGKGPRQRL
ncbi:ATP-binding protein [Actinomadura fulvescens]|uniref:Histidine kinase/HSP90-like ATPase domain-containing protein n=1 Tax=Actinomadura fulvescens TaxID=46160 RepID=A0ABN3QTZ3_9ACTN